MKNLIILLSLLLFYSSCKSQNKKEKPNILFIFVDDWGFGDLGCYGNDQIHTPNIDKLAARSKRFTRFHVTSGVCSPSRVSIITGHFPARYRVHGHFASDELNRQRGMPNWLPDTISVTLPRMLKSAGYLTAHFGKWHLGGGGLPNGDPMAPVPTRYGYDEARVWNGNGPTWKGIRQVDSAQYLDFDTLFVQQAPRLAVDATLSFINKAIDAHSPFFINLWLKEPHAQLLPSEEQRFPFRNLKEPQQTYYSVINAADRQIGRLIEEMDKLGLLKNTLIIFSSDNGPEDPKIVKGAAGSSGPYKGGKRSLYEGGIVEPFIVFWKGKVPAGTVDSTSILSSADLLPTFCKIAGAALPEFYKPDGEVIDRVFYKKIKNFQRKKPLFFEWRAAVPDHPTYWMDAAIIKNNFKLLANHQSGKVELFDISKDPFEKTNISKQNPSVVRSLLNEWETWKKTLPE